MVLEENSGINRVFVASLVETGCAARNGVLPGDVLHSVQGQPCQGVCVARTFLVHIDNLMSVFDLPLLNFTRNGT